MSTQDSISTISAFSFIKMYCVVLILTLATAFVSCSEGSNQSVSTTHKSATLSGQLKEVEALIFVKSDSAMLVLKRLKQEAFNAGDPVLKADFHRIMGKAYLNKNYIRLALQEYKEGLEETKISGDLFMQVRFLNNIGMCHTYLDELLEAIDAFEKQTQLCLQQDDKPAYFRGLMNMATINAKTGMYDLAKKQTDDALAYYQSEKESSRIAMCYMNYGTIAEYQNEFLVAIDFYEKGMKLLQNTADTNSLLNAYESLSTAHAKMSNESASMKYYYLMRSLERNDKPMRYKVMNENMLGIIMLQLKKPIEAQKAFRISYELALKSDDPLQYTIMSNLFGTSVKIGDIEEVQRLYPNWDSLQNAYHSKATNERVDELSMLVDEKSNRLILEKEKALRAKREQLLAASASGGLLLLFASLWIAYNYMRLKKQNRLLFEKNVELVKPQETSGIAEETDSLPNESVNMNLLDAFNKLLLHEKWYADPELTLSKAAAKLGTNQRYLSFAINQTTYSNFNAFVNKARITIAQRRLLTRDAENLNLEELAIQTGFSNRQTFFRAFKQVTGLSPTQYKEFNKRKSLEVVELIED